MRIKAGFLFLILLAPVVVIAFLYFFGENRYAVKGNRLAGKELPHLAIVKSDGTPMLVNLAGNDSVYDGLRARIQKRVERIRKSNGAFGFIVLRDGPPRFSPKTGIDEQQITNQSAEDILKSDLGLTQDTTPLGPWFLLLDGKGKLQNVYDLSQDRLLDTLAIEATILAEQAN